MPGTMIDAELLAATRAAIQALTAGGLASYSLNGRTVTKLSLGDLWKQVGILEERLGRAASGGGASVVEFGEPG